MRLADTLAGLSTTAVITARLIGTAIVGTSVAVPVRETLAVTRSHVAATAATVDGAANVLALIAVVSCVAVALAVGITAAVSRARVKSIAVH
jgi:hypothetical protein